LVLVGSKQIATASKTVRFSTINKIIVFDHNLQTNAKISLSLFVEAHMPWCLGNVAKICCDVDSRDTLSSPNHDRQACLFIF